MSAVQVNTTSTINIIKEDASKFIEKQGIVTILGSNFQQNHHIPASLRRTISADMSSKNWLSENGMSQMKRVSSFKELGKSTGVDDDQEELKNMSTHEDVWRSIQSDKAKGSIWSSILSEKKDYNNNVESNNQIPPYIHPLLRKSSSNLSQKSLEICTESLGSETGSEGFCFHPPSGTGSQEKENKIQEKIEEKIMQSFDDFHVAKCNYNHSHKKVGQKKSFPPPLPSLSSRNDGCPSLHMQPHRKNGRLVLEAVPVPQPNYLHVHRQEGRLLLTLIDNDPQEPNTPRKLEEEVADFQEVFDNFEDFDENADGFEDHEEDQMTTMIDQKSSGLPTSGMINIPMMKSFLGMGKKDLLWSNKINQVVELMEAEQLAARVPSIPQSLPPPPAEVARLIPLSATKPLPPPQPQSPARVASFNVYEYFWRNSNRSFEIKSSILTQQCSWNNKLKDYNNDQEVVIMRGKKGDYIVPLVCKENRRSLLVWQPHCIATS